MKHTIVSITQVFLLGCISLTATAEEKNVRLEDVPEAVRATILTKADGGTVTEIEQERTNGTLVYEVEIEKGREVIEFQVSEAGEYLGAESDDDAEGDSEVEGEDEGESVVAWAQLPEAVKEGLSATLAGATVNRVTREQEDGHTVYEAEYTVDGQERAATVTDQGMLIETESEIAGDALPAAVAARLPGNAEVREAELKTVTFYEIEFRVNGREREVRIRPDGADADDDD